MQTPRLASAPGVVVPRAEGVKTKPTLVHTLPRTASHSSSSSSTRFLNFGGGTAVTAVLLGATIAPVFLYGGAAYANTEIDSSDEASVLFEDSRSADEKELAEKLKAYVDKHFDGDYEAAFDYFDKDDDSYLSRAELIKALKKIDIGNWFTRGAWADGVLKKLDVSPKDGKLSWAELQKLTV